MNTPDKIYVGTIDGKKFSIVGEGYPFAKEYISKEAIMKLLWFLRKRRIVFTELNQVINDFKAMTNAED